MHCIAYTMPVVFNSRTKQTPGYRIIAFEVLSTIKRLWVGVLLNILDFLWRIWLTLLCKYTLAVFEKICFTLGIVRACEHLRNAANVLRKTSQPYSSKKSTVYSTVFPLIVFSAEHFFGRGNSNIQSRERETAIELQRCFSIFFSQIVILFSQTVIFFLQFWQFAAQKRYDSRACSMMLLAPPLRSYGSFKNPPFLWCLVAKEILNFFNKSVASLHDPFDERRS